VRLTELEPHFLILAPPGSDYSYREIEGIAEAQGIMFACPKCFVENGGLVNTHQVICWSRSRGVPDDVDPKPGRWTLEGTGYGDLTLNGDQSGGPGGARSILLTGGCGWHGFITNGEVT